MQWLKLISYSQLHSDNVVFIQRKMIGTAVTVIHVNNMATITETTNVLTCTRKKLCEVFEIKEKDPNWMMGFELIENEENRSILISYQQYFETVLDHFNMFEVKSYLLPMDPRCVLSRNNGPETKEEKGDMVDVSYWELVGALTWILLISCPDISFAFHYLSQFSENPEQKYWKAALHVL
jgi:hypothetical protein